MSAAPFIRISAENPEPDRVEEVVEHLRDGGLLAYPTETVYGFGCTLRPEPLERLVRLKRRAADKPLLLLIADREQATGLVWNPGAEALAQAFWPGPLTLVLPDPDRKFPAEVRSVDGGVAVRVTPHPVMRVVIEGLGEPITSTSANAPGRMPALSGEEAWRAARELLPEGAESARLRVVDGGTLAPSEPSTVIDFSGPVARLRRAGVLPVHALKTVYAEIDEPEI